MIVAFENCGGIKPNYELVDESLPPYTPSFHLIAFPALETMRRGGVLGRQVLGLLGRGGALAGGQEVLDEDSLGRVHLVGGQEAGRLGRTIAHDLPAPPA